MNKLHFWDASWPLLVEQCPCDVHFCEWLDDAQVKGAAIFHFGTGEHHCIAKHIAQRPETGNSIYGVTASKNEYQTYIDLVIADPEVAKIYNAVFCDIYLLRKPLLPVFDVVTLFHLGEFWNEKNQSYGAMTDRQLTELMLDRMPSGGKLLVYKGSYAFDKAEAVVDALEKEGQIVREPDFKTLRVYHKA